MKIDLSNQPLYISQAHVHKVMDENGRLAREDQGFMSKMMEAFQLRKMRAKDEGYELAVKDGVAIIPVDGTLLHKLGMVDVGMWGLTGYDAIRHKIDVALQRDEVKGILLDVDSPGGEVAGANALAEYIAKAGKIKPIWAMANETMASAAYYIAAGASKVYAAPGAVVGSVGVIYMHMSSAEALKKYGYKATIIRSAELKAKPSFYEDMTDDDVARVQASVDEAANAFISFVAKARGIDESVVRDTKADVLSPTKALNFGMIDGVMSFDDVLDEFVQSLNRPQGQATAPSGQEGSEAMTVQSQTAAQPATTGGATASAETQDQKQAGIVEERSRVSAILAAATGKEATAKALIDGGVPAEQAVAILGTVPAASAGNAVSEQALAAMSEVASVTMPAEPQKAMTAGELANQKAKQFAEGE